MQARLGALAVVAASVVLAVGMADELKSGPETKTGGAFQVKAITGGEQGKQLCYV